MLLTGRVGEVIEFLHGVVVFRCDGCRHGPQCLHFFSHSTSMGQASTAFQGSHQCLLDDKVRAKACPVLVAAADHMETLGKLVMYIRVSGLELAHFLEVEICRFQVVVVPSGSKYWQTVQHCAQVHLPRSCTICFDQSSGCLQHLLIVYSQPAGF